MKLKLYVVFFLNHLTTIKQIKNDLLIIKALVSSIKQVLFPIYSNIQLYFPKKEGLLFQFLIFAIPIAVFVMLHPCLDSIFCSTFVPCSIFSKKVEQELEQNKQRKIVIFTQLFHCSTFFWNFFYYIGVNLYACVTVPLTDIICMDNGCYSYRKYLFLIYFIYYYTFKFLLINLSIKKWNNGTSSYKQRKIVLCTVPFCVPLF